MNTLIKNHSHSKKQDGQLGSLCFWILFCSVFFSATSWAHTPNPLVQFYRITPEEWHQQISEKLVRMDLAINKDWKNSELQLFNGCLSPISETWAPLNSFRFRFPNDFRSEYDFILFHDKISRLHNIGMTSDHGEPFKLPSLAYLYLTPETMLTYKVLREVRWNTIIFNQKKYPLGKYDFQNLIHYLSAQNSETQELRSHAGLTIFKLVHKGIVEDLLNQATYKTQAQGSLNLDSEISSRLEQEFITGAEQHIQFPIALELSDIGKHNHLRGPINWGDWLDSISNQYQVDLLVDFLQKSRGATPLLVSRLLPYLRVVQDKAQYETFKERLQITSAVSTDVIGRSGLDYLNFDSEMRIIANLPKANPPPKRPGPFCRLLIRLHLK